MLRPTEKAKKALNPDESAYREFLRRVDVARANPAGLEPNLAQLLSQFDGRES